MANRNLQTSDPPFRPELHPTSQALHTALRLACNALAGEAELPASALPDMARIGLKNRLADLRAALAPASRDGVIQVLASLSDMPSQAESDPAKRRFSLEQAVADLEGLPEWALTAAARVYRKGEIGDGHWRPTTGELAKLAREKMRQWAKECAEIDAVLRARIAPSGKPIDPEQRKRLADMLRGAVRPESDPP